MQDKKPALYIDKDGTILLDKHPNYSIPFKFNFNTKLINFIKDLQRKNNYYLFLITNQPDYVLGKVSFRRFIHYFKAFIRELKKQYDLEFDDIFICIHHEKAKSKKWRNCNCRKPKTGLIDKSLLKWHIDLENSIIIGDTWRDRDLAKKLNIKFISIK